MFGTDKKRLFQVDKISITITLIKSNQLTKIKNEARNLVWYAYD